MHMDTLAGRYAYPTIGVSSVVRRTPGVRLPNYRDLIGFGRFALPSFSLASTLLAQSTEAMDPEGSWAVPVYVAGRKWAVAPESTAASLGKECVGRRAKLAY